MDILVFTHSSLESYGLDTFEAKVSRKKQIKRKFDIVVGNY